MGYEIDHRCLSQDFTDDKSILVQVMAWCRQATSHYLSQCCPRSLSPYGVTRPQWVKCTWCQWNFVKWKYQNETRKICAVLESVVFRHAITCIYRSFKLKFNGFIVRKLKNLKKNNNGSILTYVHVTYFDSMSHTNKNWYNNNITVTKIVRKIGACHANAEFSQLARTSCHTTNNTCQHVDPCQPELESFRNAFVFSLFLTFS